MGRPLYGFFAVQRSFSDRQVRGVKQPGLVLATFYKCDLSETPIIKLKSPAGYFVVSTPEATAGDLVAYHRCCPSLDHAATVLVELAERINRRRLADLPSKGFGLAGLQRLGWLLDHVKWPEKTERLCAVLSRNPLNWVRLESRLPPDGRRNTRWRVIENTDVHPDVER